MESIGYLIAGCLFLFTSCVFLFIGIGWIVSWINHLALFVMQIYKDEPAQLDSKPGWYISISLPISLFFYSIFKVFISYYMQF